MGEPSLQVLGPWLKRVAEEEGSQAKARSVEVFLFRGFFWVGTKGSGMGVSGFKGRLASGLVFGRHSLEFGVQAKRILVRDLRLPTKHAGACKDCCSSQSKASKRRKGVRGVRFLCSSLLIFTLHGGPRGLRVSGWAEALMVWG